MIPLIAITGGVSGAAAVGALAGPHPSIRAGRLTPTEALAAA
ncbi:hypothetical protein [Actinophytocola sp.]